MPLVGRSLGEMLLKDGVITQKQLDEAMEKQKKTERCLARIFVDMNIITEVQKINFLKKKLNLRVVDLEKEDIDVNAVKTIPKNTADKYHIFPYNFEEGRLLVAMDDPTDILLLDTLETQTGYQITPVLTHIASIDSLINKYAERLIDNEITQLEMPLLGRIIKSLITVLILLVPGGILYWLLKVSKQIQNLFSSISHFERFLYIFIIWAFWAIIVFYINGLIFSKEKRII